MSPAQVLGMSDEELDALVRHHNTETHELAFRPLGFRERRAEDDRRALARWNEMDRRQA